MLSLLFNLLTLHQVSQHLACQGTGENDTNETTTEEATTTIYDSYRNNFKYALTIPDSLKARYGRWLINYVKEKYEEKKDPPPRIGPMPGEWTGYGPGEGNSDPPPWATIKSGYGKPDYCFLNILFGNCTRFWRRWAYNMYTNACERFFWSGCGGNMNNFVQKYQCEAACIKEQMSNCDIFGSFVET